jgi:cation:H+ antiporter
MSFEQITFLCLGLAFLTFGAELLVRGASRLAALLGISPLVIGLTVVAFGTSAPELAVSVGSALSGQADLALGNVVGSNIFNILFILGLCAVIVPLRVAQQLLWLDVPLMIAASLFLLLLGIDGSIGRVDGMMLFSGILLYTVFAVSQGRKESREVEAEYAGEFAAKQDSAWDGWLAQVLFVGAGLVMLVLGSRWLVGAAVQIAKLLGISELVVGLTVVAAGTSLPEVAASVVASLRGERDIAVGNVVGSNLFNILCVIGLSSLVSPDGIKVAPAALTFDIPVMIAVALACAPIFFTGHLIARWEGMVFILYYTAYTGYLILNAKQHDSLPAFSILMMEFVVPLTLLTLAITYVRHAARSRAPLSTDSSR